MKTYEELAEDLRKWFGKGKQGDWVRVGTDGKIKGDCAREPGEGKPKCMPRSKAHSMDKDDRASAARRKRAKDPVADRSGKGGKPVMVSTDKKEEFVLKTFDEFISEGNKKGLWANIRAKKARGEAPAKKGDKNYPDELEKIRENVGTFHAEDYELFLEKNVPTKPALWSKYKSQAKSKFDVYPSAYANGWAAKQYKKAGGGWKSVSEEVCCSECESMNEDLISEDIVIMEEGEKKKVALNKVQRGGSKKFYVYVKNAKGNVVKVSFGDPNMEIKRDDPKARASFRARHDCANKKDRTKAGYWSCRQWRGGAKVES
tara:strand:- start:980 stop:1927 length:948 start_codon:yes stop_codon:yes gene_type:complete